MTRECLAAISDTSISGRRAARELTTLIERRSKPGIIASDKGTEFTSNACWPRRSKTTLPCASTRRASPRRMDSARLLTAGREMSLRDAANLSAG
jgi:transposase InsO family protein